MTDVKTKDAKDIWARDFDYISVKRDGHILEITIDRADRYNALHGGAHQELHDIFDGYEQDPDLWVAIITGAGDKAFCSGLYVILGIFRGSSRQPCCSNPCQAIKARRRRSIWYTVIHRRG